LKTERVNYSGANKRQRLKRVAGLIEMKDTTSEKRGTAAQIKYTKEKN
jgi:hypothetical protein